MKYPNWIGCLLSVSALAAGTLPAGASSFEEIVVTARKRTESLTDVPISLSALSGRTLERMAVRDITSASKMIPNIYVDQVAAGPRVSIRGLGNSQTGGVVDSSVGLGIDGLFYGRPRWLSVGLFDVESFEVLRGPQSTYFGKNTTAGMVNIRTRNPGDEWSGHVQAGYEFDIGGYNVEAAVGGPLSDKFGIRLAYRHSESDGYLKLIGTDQDVPDSNEDIARLTLTWSPTDNISVNYKLTYFNGRENGNGQEVGACSAAYVATLQAISSPEDCVLNYRKSPEGKIPGGLLPDTFYTRNKGWNHALNISFEIGDFTLSSVSGYNRLISDWSADGDWGTLNFFNVHRPEKYEQYSQELRLQSSVDKPISFVVGGYFDDADRSMNQNVDAAAFGISFFRNLQVKAKSYAVFGEVTGKVTPDFLVVAGVRYTDVHQRGRLMQNGGLLGDLATDYPGSDYDFQQRLNKDNWSPSLTLQYYFDSSAQIYASYKRGFKAGGFDLDKNANANTFNYDHEKAESFEVGIKAGLLDQRILVTAAAFQTDVDDLQVQSYTGTGPTALILNAASARLRGLEAEMLFRITEALTANLNFGYIDTKYRSFPAAPCTLGQIAAALCSGSPATQDLSGKRLPLAPKYTFSASVDYFYPVLETHDLAFNGTLTHRSAAFLTIENDPLSYTKSLTLADVRLGLEPRDGGAGFMAAIIGRNVFDKKYVTGAIALPSADSWAYQVGRPRTIEIQLGYRF